MNIEKALVKYPGASISDFGDNKDLSDLLIALVRNGKKTATCSALRDYLNENESLPFVGRVTIIVNFEDRQPVIAIEAIEVNQVKFCDIDESFALDEGENEDIRGWREDHQAYFERNGGFHAEMILVCERFKLIEDFLTT